MGSNSAVLWHQHCSACCFLPCSRMLFRTVTLVFQSGTVNGNLFNLRRLQAKTKVHTDVLDELLYADDMDKKVQVGKDQEKAQSEKDSHSKNQSEKKPN